MIKIIIWTTPTIRYKFSVADPNNFAEAILTFKDIRSQEKLRKTLETATIGNDYIEWTLSQAETLSLGSGNHMSMMLNWLTDDGTRGASVKEDVQWVNNHIREVIGE